MAYMADSSNSSACTGSLELSCSFSSFGTDSSTSHEEL